MLDSHLTISTILKHESKQNTYKIALVRAINDVALEFPHIGDGAHPIAIPLRLLAQFWIAYYWVFADPNFPIRQGHNSTDLAFRNQLTQFRLFWQDLSQLDSPSDGFYIKNQLSIHRSRHLYPEQFFQLYQNCLLQVMKALEMPIKYAGTGEYNLFSKPQKFINLSHSSIPIPNTSDQDKCLLIPHNLWQSFQDLSLWIEALCIHEWCLFTDTVRQVQPHIDRGKVYTLLTARPDNRRPLTWERNQIDLLMMEGEIFNCPWTEKRIHPKVAYELDHIIPIAIRPINELWNLIPTDPKFNLYKRDRLPSKSRIQSAEPILSQTYQTYMKSSTLKTALQEDAQIRFGLSSPLPTQLAHSTRLFIEGITKLRQLAEFD